jgi:CDP-2,3-bis-(O-geranylgeranyl)-sn-glycerol synthase
MLIIKLLVLLAVSNAAPVFARKLFEDRFSWPVDAGLRFFDGQPLFGTSKTIRGIVFSIVFTAIGAWLMGLGWEIGVVIGAVSMAGDLFSSFTKRRLKMPASSRATGLDQVPEALFPLLACQQALGLGVTDILAVVALFFAGSLILSPLFHKLNIRKRPY